MNIKLFATKHCIFETINLCLFVGNVSLGLKAPNALQHTWNVTLSICATPKIKMNSRDLLESVAISSEGGVQLADLCVPESEAGTERDTEDRAVGGERSTLCG